MFGIVGKLFGGIFRTLLLGILLIGGLLGGGYYWWINNQLQKTLAGLQVNEGYIADYQLLTRSNARIETSWPLTTRAYIKETKAHNWSPTPDHGLVKAILQWSPDQNRWVEEPLEQLPAGQRLKLEGLVKNPIKGYLIDALKDGDPVVREVAIRELKIRTNQDFGYRYDAPDAERAAATASWEQWWEENKYRDAGGKILDKVREIIK